jgi:hypothetical protein
MHPISQISFDKVLKTFKIILSGPSVLYPWTVLFPGIIYVYLYFLGFLSIFEFIVKLRTDQYIKRLSHLDKLSGYLSFI